MKVFNERVQREDLRASILVTIVRQALGDKKAKQSDYFPSLRDNAKPKQTERTLAQRMRQNIRAYQANRDKVKKGNG